MSIGNHDNWHEPARHTPLVAASSEEIEFRRRIGAWIAWAMKERDIDDQTAAAEGMGIDQSYVSRLLSATGGGRTPSIFVLRKIRAWVGVPWVRFLEESPKDESGNPTPISPSPQPERQRRIGGK